MSLYFFYILEKYNAIWDTPYSSSAISANKLTKFRNTSQ